MKKIESIDNLVLIVNNLLTKYIQLHNRLFKFSIKKIIPIPFIFKPIDFNKFSYEINEVLDGLKWCYRERSNFPMSNQNKELMIIMEKYIFTLILTLEQLLLVSENLRNKANGEVYDFKIYKQDVDRYNELVEKYRYLGKQLNMLWNKNKDRI